MITVTVKPDLSKLLKQLGANAKDAVQKGLLAGCWRGVTEMQNRTTHARVVDRGLFRMSWKAAPIPQGARIYNDSPYAPIIEEGRRPGARMPPARILEDWARRKLGLSARAAKEASFPIARAIGIRGLPAKHLLRDAVPALTQLVENELVAEVRKAVIAAGGKP